MNMKNKAKQKITLSTGNMFAILIVTLLGSNFLDLSSCLAKYSGPSGYWSLGVAALIMLLVIGLAQLIGGRFPGQNLWGIAPGVIGKPLAHIGNLLFLSSFLIWCCLAIRDGVDLILTYLLNRTPFWAALLLFLSGVAYIALNGLATVSRFIAFLLVPVYILRIIMGLFILQKIEVSHLLPLFSDTPGEYLRGGLVITVFFLPLTTNFLMINRLKKPAKAGLISLSALGGVFPVFLLGILGTIGTFGAKYTQFFNWPEISAVHHVNIPFMVIEQLGLLFVIVWITTFFATQIYYFYVIADGLKQQFPALNYQWTIIILSISAGIIGMVYPSSIVAHQLFSRIRPWLIIPVTAYPGLLYLMALLRKKRG